MTARYRKLPVEIDAIQWTGDNIIDVTAFMRPQEPVYVNNLSHMNFTNADDLIGIQTPEGLVVANLNDWIIRGVAGKLYPCKPDIFAATYESVASFEPHERPQDDRAAVDRNIADLLSDENLDAHHISASIQAAIRQVRADLAEVRKSLRGQFMQLATNSFFYPAGAGTYGDGYADGRRDAYNAAAEIVGEWKATDDG